jgi:multiple sugar transport system substrate-binding protein
LRRRTSRPRSTPSTPPTQHIPNAGYVEKISTQLAAGDPPDIAYLDETQAFPWAAEGKLLDLTPYFDGQPERTLVKNIVYRAGDHLIGTGLATGVILTYYNKDIFDKAGVPYPPARADQAWTWDEFLANAKKLTKDRAGHDAADPAFDPNQIETYGVAISPHWWGNYIPFIYSAGGKVEGQRISWDIVADKRTGKSSADNLKPA